MAEEAHSGTITAARMRFALIIGLLVAMPTANGQAVPGPAVGSRVPGFEATDQNGRVWPLQKLMGPKGLMLVFYRSADW